MGQTRVNLSAQHNYDPKYSKPKSHTKKAKAAKAAKPPRKALSKRPTTAKGPPLEFADSELEEHSDSELEEHASEYCGSGEWLGKRHSSGSYVFDDQ